MFLQFRNANTIQYKKSLHSKVVKKMYTKMSSVQGSNVLTVKALVESRFQSSSVPYPKLQTAWRVFGTLAPSLTHNVDDLLRQSRQK